MAKGSKDWEDPFANETFHELECFFRFVNGTVPGNSSGCISTWDHLICWPPTAPGTLAVVPCVESFRGVHYDTSQNVTRMCREDGTWAAKSDYSHCKPLLPVDIELQDLWDMKEASTVYYVGYGISLVALVIALCIFFYIKDLRCLRNTIHTNLLVTFTLMDLTWIVTATLQSNPVGSSNQVCCILVVFLTYLMATNFFWMFVEGLYLYILVVKTFSLENIKFYVYAFIGWGLPGAVVVMWATVKSVYADADDLLTREGCLWQNRDTYDYILMCPIILILLINVFFLCEIMWVLITKLRAPTSIESKQYRKAAKALLVLIPLLGITYVVVIVTPPHRTARVIFSYLQAVLLSTQGFTVALFYCFLSSEVRASIRQRMERWKTRKSLDGLVDHRSALVYRFSLPSRRESQPASGSVCNAAEETSCVSFKNSEDGKKARKNGNGNVNGGSRYGPLPIFNDQDNL